MILRLLAALGILTLLAGCFQAEMKIEILSSDEGRATTTISMDRTMYNNFAANGGFCDDGEISLSDVSATCVFVNIGSLAELTLAADKEDQPVPVTVLENGNLRVALPLGEFAKNAPNDPQTMAMMGQMLAGSNITIIIAGKKIVDTNMTLAADGKSASFALETLTMLTQTDTLPAELYAIVDPN